MQKLVSASCIKSYHYNINIQKICVLDRNNQKKNLVGLSYGKLYYKHSIWKRIGSLQFKSQSLTFQWKTIQNLRNLYNNHLDFWIFSQCSFRSQKFYFSKQNSDSLNNVLCINNQDYQKCLTIAIKTLLTTKDKKVIIIERTWILYDRYSRDLLDLQIIKKTYLNFIRFKYIRKYILNIKMWRKLLTIT
ncbi:unnamed protein product [Paramecium sonneborni]|uniref:Uncharacterized protein n=1 Tax=Paramecium sonneborni TaxID=65129 RepID=A0A8S1RN09_9CILI|nr:unnamed protein product [Paramecium sonneborni]